MRGFGGLYLSDALQTELCGKERSSLHNTIALSLTFSVMLSLVGRYCCVLYAFFSQMASSQIHVKCL